ncbi:MAG TPA: acetate uptake transporter, partial [Syntrophorhabdaceae bacterium]|nr:acetate uptake transporter [Syntrophorhabdaceae bacterium]
SIRIYPAPAETATGTCVVICPGGGYGALAFDHEGHQVARWFNTFGVTAFTSYGLFWWTLVFILVFKGLPGNPEAFMGWYLFMWGLFTFFMWFGTWGKNRAIQFVFLSLTILFWLLAIRDWSGSAAIGTLAGWEGIICGLSAVYLAMAEVLNEVHGRTVLPIGEIKK